MTRPTAATSAAAREGMFIDLIVQVAHADMKRVALGAGRDRTDGTRYSFGRCFASAVAIDRHSGSLAPNMRTRCTAKSPPVMPNIRP